jgi:ataxin-3
MQKLVYHEKQEGHLCAVHCLNVLLQEKYYSGVELSKISRYLDGLEKNVVKNFSGDTNFDETGFFGIQVIEEALKVWGLELLRIFKKEFKYMGFVAFIVNEDKHWYCIRKFIDDGKDKWFNLNSLLESPTEIYEPFGVVENLLEKGHSVFGVKGNLQHLHVDRFKHAGKGNILLETKNNDIDSVEEMRRKRLERFK